MRDQATASESMTIDDLMPFLRKHRWGVQSTVDANGVPQSALVGYAVTDRHELVFDTLLSTRKAINVRRNPNIAFAIGGGFEGEMQTLQCNGIADFPTGDELERIKTCYYMTFPDGPDRLAWEGITYIRVVLTWIRFSDFSVDPPMIAEFNLRGESR